MSRDYDSYNDDYPTAVAAAAYAVRSLDESKARDRNASFYGHSKPLNKMKSEAENKEIRPGLRKSTLKFSDETSKQSSKGPDTNVSNTWTSEKMTKMTEDPAPLPAFKNKTRPSDTDENTSKHVNPDKHWHTNGSKKTETTSPKPDHSPIGWPKSETRGQSTAKPGPADSMAEAWEKEEMASIKERYESLRATIDNWELKKKKKVDQKLERIEEENRRAKAVQSHRDAIKRIEEIAGGARAQAEAKRRKEELKVKEKANKIRSTGKIPATCFCF